MASPSLSLTLDLVVLFFQHLTPFPDTVLIYKKQLCIKKKTQDKTCLKNPAFCSIQLFLHGSHHVYC